MFALMLACTAAPPTLNLSDPSQGKPGETVKLIGAEFQPGASATMGGQDLGVSVLGATVLQGTVPELGPGQYAVVVENPDGQSVTLQAAFEIAAPPAELKICDASYTAYTQLAGGRELIKIDIHTQGSETPESLEIKFRDVQAVEYEGRVQGDALCSAIILHLKSGRRLVYEDSKELLFKKKAQELAQVIGVPVDVIMDESLKD